MGAVESAKRRRHQPWRMEALIAVEHAGCYTSEMTRRLGIQITVLSGHETPDGSVGLWVMTGPEEALPLALMDLESHPNIVRADVLRKQPGAWVLETVDKEAEVANALIGAGLVFLPPVVIRDGVERYRVFALERRQIDQAVRALTPQNKVQVLSLRERDVAANPPLASLSKSQRAAMEQAYRMGWYERPRGTDQAAIAAKLGISRPALAERLQRAEAHIMRAIFES